MILVATAGFVIGTSIERHNTHHESAAAPSAEGVTVPDAEGGGESAATHAAETGGGTTEQHEELRPLGIDVEAVPFVGLAALASLALAALGWTKSRWLLGLAAIAVAMLVFGALDVREVFNQSDESHTGLAILAAAIAALHFGATVLAVAMGTRAAATEPSPARTTAT